MPPIHTSTETYTQFMLLVDNILQSEQKTSLHDYLAAKRSGGLSFELIARDLTEMIGTKGFSVGYQGVRRWCHRLGIEEVAS